VTRDVPESPNIAGFASVGVTRVEIHPLPHTIDVLEQLAPVFAALT
jgi:hypothetical protein